MGTSEYAGYGKIIQTKGKIFKGPKRKRVLTFSLNLIKFLRGYGQHMIIPLPEPV